MVDVGAGGGCSFELCGRRLVLGNELTRKSRARVGDGAGQMAGTEARQPLQDNLCQNPPVFVQPPSMLYIKYPGFLGHSDELPASLCYWLSNDGTAANLRVVLCWESCYRDAQ